MRFIRDIKGIYSNKTGNNKLKIKQRKTMKTILRKIHLLIPLVLLMLVTAWGCKDNAVVSTDGTLELNQMGSSDTVDTGLLVITQVKILVKDIKLNVSNSGQDTTNFKVGPYVLILNFAGISLIDQAIIPAGTYDKIRFMIHKLGDTEPIPDPDFADSLGRYSVIVKGTYAGVDFVYKSDKSAHQKLSSSNSIVIGPSSTTSVTLKVKPYIWFIKNFIYLDPRDPNNRNDIDNNIKDNINNNFKCFKDNNKDGQPD